MIHVHEYHNHCEHEVAYCAKCDVAYCKKCGREWGKQYTWYWQPYYPYYGTTTITYGNNTDAATSASFTPTADANLNEFHNHAA